MYQRIKNRLDAGFLLEEIRKQGKDAFVGERIAELAGVLDDAYGAGRKAQGMGGYILYFPDAQTYEDTVVDIWEFYHIEPTMYEYMECIGLLYVDHINQNTEMWKSNDDLADYSTGIMESFGSSMTECVAEGADIGGEIGSVFGRTGKVVGTVVGGIIGAGVGLVKGVFGALTGGCYITTAVCEEYGKPDDCYELAAFRKFRDGWLSEQPDGVELIGRYYNTAPVIVALINKQENRSEIYHSLNEEYLSKCLAFIESSEYQRCKETYMQMMEHLFKEQDKWLSCKSSL